MFLYNDIFVVKENYLKKVINKSKVENKYIKKVFRGKDGELFFFAHPYGFLEYRNKKLMPVSKELNDLFIDNEAYCFKYLRGGYVAIGTVSNGIIIIDENNINRFLLLNIFCSCDRCKISP